MPSAHVLPEQRDAMPEAPRCLVVVQARLASARLPAKALLPLGGMPSFVLCARRAANAGLSVVVATSDEVTDHSLVDVARAAGLQVARGAHDDVLARFAAVCADLPDDALVVRLTADNPLPDGAFISMLVSRFRRLEVDYLGTSSPVDGLPYGLSAEVFTASVLRRAQAHAVSASDREHVTPWIRREARSAIYHHDGAAPGWSRLRCTLDTFEDYLHLQRLFATEPDPTGVAWTVLVERVERLSGATEALCPFRIGADGAVQSTLALGTAQLGLPDYGVANRAGLPADDAAAALLVAAVEAGITWIDTARAYGLAEDRIGRLLSAGQRARVRIVTKLDPMSHVELKASARRVCDAVDASVFRSLHALRARSLDTLLLHRWAHRNAWAGAAWERLLELQSGGLIGRLGASVSSVDEAMAALSDPAISHLQCPVNLIDARWRDPGLLAAATKRSDVTVHARSALLQGLLTLPAERWPDVSGYDRAGLAGVLDDAVVRYRRQDRIDLCLAYVRSLPWVHSIVVGMETLEQLRSNLSSFRQPVLFADELADIERRLPMLPETVVDPSRWGKA
jgi:spore coat polysaccharide biosynthesis protein SpsF